MSDKQKMTKKCGYEAVELKTVEGQPRQLLQGIQASSLLVSMAMSMV